MLILENTEENTETEKDETNAGVTDQMITKIKLRLSYIIGLENRPDIVGLIANIVPAVLLGSFVRFLIFSNGWHLPISNVVRVDMPISQRANSLIWVVLFMVTACVRWLVVRRAKNLRFILANCITVFLVLLAMFPLYTLAADSTVNGMVGGSLMAVFSLVLAFFSRTVSKTATVFFLIMTLWVVFGTYKTYQQHQINHKQMLALEERALEIKI